MTVSMAIQWDHKPTKKINIDKIFTAWADDIGPLVLAVLKERTPVVTGTMRDSSRYSRTSRSGGVRLEFTVYTKYSRWVIGGAEPHIIRANAARSLHWTDDMGGHFAKVVHHPGNRPNDYPKQVMDAMRDEVLQNLKQRIDAALKGSP
jgi:hypothetical protein